MWDEEVEVGASGSQVRHAVLHAGTGAPSCKDGAPITSACSHCCLLSFSFVWLKMAKTSGKRKELEKKDGSYWE